MKNFRHPTFLTLAALVLPALNLASVATAQQTKTPHEKPAQENVVAAAKLIVGDLKQNQTYFETMFGMKATGHFNAAGVYDESIMSFTDGDAGLALFSPLKEAAIKKSQFPVALIDTPDLDGLVKRLQDAKYPVMRLPKAQSGTFTIAIATDPSGNKLELFSRPGKWDVGGAKLIVNDRQKAEDFYTHIFHAKAGQRFKTPTYDEVLMSFGDGPFLALFQPLAEAPLPKSQFPVVAIYTHEFDKVLKRVKAAGFGYQDVKTSSAKTRIIVAKDPAGNAVEIIRRP